MEAELRTSLSGTSVLHCHRILRKALQDALQLDLVPRNVADSVITPRKDTPEMRAFIAEELREFLAATGNSPFATLFHVAAQTGLRRSELCGLRWSDIDLEERTLTVRRTVQRVRGQGLVSGNPKTEKSRRTVVLGDEIAGKLRRHRARQAESRLIAGAAWIDQDHVFTQVDGGPVDPDGVTHTFAAAARGLGVGALSQLAAHPCYSAFRGGRPVEDRLVKAWALHDRDHGRPLYSRLQGRTGPGGPSR
jgi:integrase